MLITLQGCCLLAVALGFIWGSLSPSSSLPSMAFSTLL